MKNMENLVIQLLMKEDIILKHLIQLATDLSEIITEKKPIQELVLIPIILRIIDLGIREIEDRIEVMVVLRREILIQEILEVLLMDLLIGVMIEGVVEIMVVLIDAMIGVIMEVVVRLMAVDIQGDDMI